MSNFDTNFETHKAGFKKLFGIEWNANHSLYLQYVQLRYTSAVADVVSDGLARLSQDNKEIKELLKSVVKK